MSECNQSVRVSLCGPVWTPDQICIHVSEISVALSSDTLSEGSVGCLIICSYCRCWRYIFTYLKFKSDKFKPLIQVFSVLSFAFIVLPSSSSSLHDEESRLVVTARVWHFICPGVIYVLTGFVYFLFVSIVVQRQHMHPGRHPVVHPSRDVAWY
jgi:hypothetical protein